MYINFYIFINVVIMYLLFENSIINYPELIYFAAIYCRGSRSLDFNVIR